MGSRQRRAPGAVELSEHVIEHEQRVFDDLMRRSAMTTRPQA
jgi:hypothetical protein